MWERKLGVQAGIKLISILGVVLCIGAMLTIIDSEKPVQEQTLSKQIHVFQSSRSLPASLIAHIHPHSIIKTLPVNKTLHADQSSQALQPVSGGKVDDTSQPQWTVLSFGYTRCATRCQSILTYIAQEINTLGVNKNRFRFLFASIDPYYDTLAMISKYTYNFHQDILPLYLNAGELHRLGSEVFNLSPNTFSSLAMAAPPPEPDESSWPTNRLFIFNPQSQWIAYYTVTPQAGVLSSDLQLLEKLM